ncbi:MAG: hypothetical protein ACYC0X_28510 [Pirellulaceae bacterium]
MNVPTNSTRVPRSMALYARATELIPGAAQLISRRASGGVGCDGRRLTRLNPAGGPAGHIG